MSVLPVQLAGLLPGKMGDDSRADRPGGLRRTVSRMLGRSSRQPQAASAQRIITPPAEAEAGAKVKDRALDWPSDEELLAAYLEGDRSAFTNLMGRYSNELLHFLTRFLSSRAAAEDVFQETFLQVHLSAESFDPQRRFKPWLFTIAANKARDYHRKHARQSAVSLSSSIDSSGEGERFIDLMESSAQAPTAPLLDAERSRLVKKVIDSLPVHLREILLLSYFQRLSYSQIADALEIPLGTVKSRLHTAVAAFARAWEVQRGSNEFEGGRKRGQTGTDQS